MVDLDRNLGKIAQNSAAADSLIKPDLGTHTVADRRRANEWKAAADEEMVKANVLPAIPTNFPSAESLAGATPKQTLDANNKVSSETATLAQSLIPGDSSTDLKRVIKFDANGGVASTETSWKDAQNKTHDVLAADGKTTNTIIDGNKTDSLVTYDKGKSWQHNVSVRAEDGKTLLYKDNITVGEHGHVNAEDKFLAKSIGGDLNFHRTIRYKDQKATDDMVTYKTADGMQHEVDNFAYGDNVDARLKTVKNGDDVTVTPSDKNNAGKAIKVLPDGSTVQTW